MRIACTTLVSLALLSGCVSPQNRLYEGEAHLSRSEWDLAASAFKDALDSDKLPQLERTKAAVGEARAFIGKGDLVGAETRLRRLSDQVSAKWYHLGEVNAGRKDRAAAIDCYRKALERRHGGDTALRLARLLGGEARTFDELAEAAKVLRTGGELVGAKALDEATGVWRAMLAGEPAGRLLERLVRHQSFLSGYASTVVLRARLLDQAGDNGRAETAWSMNEVKPPPSLAFVTWAREQRAQDAITRGDVGALAKALENADPRTAAAVRERLASNHLWRGDRAGAQSLWQATIDAGGDPAPLAATRLATSLELDGRSELAAKTWPASGGEEEPRIALLRARRRARDGDLLGGCALLDATSRSMLHSDAGASADDLLSAGALLRAALAAHASGEDEDASRLARAVLQVAPLEPACLVLLERREDAAREPSGHTLLALRRAELVRHLRAGELDEAKQIVGWWKLTRMEQRDKGGDLPLDELTRDLLTHLHEGLREALIAGRREQVPKFISAVSLDPNLPAMARLRACDCLSAVDSLPAPRGLRALPVDVTLRGHLAIPSRSLHLSAVALTRTASGGWKLQLPGATRLTFRDGKGLEEFLGATLDQVRWAEHLADVDPTETPEAWKRGPLPEPPLGVE